ncbi:putative efflux system component YknX [bioreactor metagenome]|uniref:Putative efflux system component YknX n=1 Tax=bioreactor metagenome TaxID=1076179 RepID=A0A645DET3_9ZZZZ
MTRLINAYEQAKLNLRKIRISTESKIVQADKSIENYRGRIRRTGDQLSRYKEYMTMMELTAPVDGVVIYADPDRRWGNLDVKPGIDINKGQVLVTIPEMSNLVVDFDLPEQYRSKIRIGDRSVISPDSLPGQKFSGTVSHIDTLPVNMVNWDSASPKIYKSKIKLDSQSPKLVNGMSVQINIVTKTIPNAIFIPVEAVFEDNDRFYVYRSGLTGSKEVDVKIGESNDKFVQITDGLEEGDVVYLYRPYQKKQDSKK